MEFKEFTEMYKRMCSRNTCSECSMKALFDSTASDAVKRCRVAVLEKPTRAEEILTRWNKNRNFIGNKELFSKLFELRPWTKYNSTCGHSSACVAACGMSVPCDNCDWWNDKTEITTSDNYASGFMLEFSDKGGDEQ